MLIQFGRTLSHYAYLFLSLRSESEFTLEARSTSSDDYFTATSGNSGNGSVPSDPSQLFTRADCLLDGTDDDKEEAYRILAQNEKKVCKHYKFLYACIIVHQHIVFIVNAKCQIMYGRGGYIYMYM